MGLINGVLNFARRVASPASVVVQPFLTRINLLTFGPDMKARELVKFYRHWVYVAATKNSTSVAAVPLRLYVTTGPGEKQYKYLRKGIDTRPLNLKQRQWLKSKKNLQLQLRKSLEVEEVIEHPFLDIWKNVNPYMNGFEMLETLQLFLELTGNAYLYVWHNALGIPEELWILPSQYVTVVPSKKNFVQGYIYGTSPTNAIAFAPEEVVHFRFPNPNDQFYGYSPLQATIAAAIRKDDMDAFEDSLLKNYARPDFFLKTKNRVRTQDIERLREEFQKLYGRRKGRGRPAILDNDMSVENVGWSPREMAMLKGQKFTREEILASFGVPNSKVTSENVNLANADVGEIQYQRDTILPRLNRNEDKLNEDLVGAFDSRLFVAFDNPVPQNEEFKLKERDTNLKNYSWTINDVLEEEGREPVPWGDVPLVPFNIVPLGSVTPGEMNQPIPNEEERAVTPQQDVESKIHSNVNKGIVEWDYCEPHTEGHFHHSCCDSSNIKKFDHDEKFGAPTTKLRTMTILMRRWFADIEKMVLDLMKPKTMQNARTKYLEFLMKEVPPELANLGLNLDMNEWIKLLSEYMGAPIREQLARGGAIGMSRIDASIAFDVLNPEVRAFMERYVAHFSRIISENTSRRFLNQLRIGFEKGESIPELTTRVQNMFGGLKRYKAEQIARSEASRSVHMGMLEAWKQSGVVEAIVWDSQSDACPWCQEMEGRIVSLGSNFWELGDSMTVNVGEGDDMRQQSLTFNYEPVAAPPLHPNCECDIRAIQKEV